VDSPRSLPVVLVTKLTAVLNDKPGLTFPFQPAPGSQAWIRWQQVEEQETIALNTRTLAAYLFQSHLGPGSTPPNR